VQVQAPQQVTQTIVSTAEACISQSKPDRNMKHAPLPYWNEDCKNAITKEIVLEINLTTKCRRKMLETTKD